MAVRTLLTGLPALYCVFHAWADAFGAGLEEELIDDRVDDPRWTMRQQQQQHWQRHHHQQQHLQQHLQQQHGLRDGPVPEAYQALEMTTVRGGGRVGVNHRVGASGSGGGRNGGAGASDGNTPTATTADDGGSGDAMQVFVASERRRWHARRVRRRQACCCGCCGCGPSGAVKPVSEVCMVVVGLGLAACAAFELDITAVRECVRASWSGVETVAMSGRGLAWMDGWGDAGLIDGWMHGWIGRAQPL
jgi:hypothetical protein